MPSTSRPPLSRGTVLRAGLALADEEGLEAVTMRRLAERLDVVPMALYKHVADKEDLVGGMVDLLVEAMAEPSAPVVSTTDWPQALRQALSGARRVVMAHTWARRAIESRTIRTPAVLAHMERVSAIFLASGFTPDLTHHVMHLLGNRIWGFSPELFTTGSPGPGGPAEERPAAPARRSRGPEVDPNDYPSILAITADARSRRPGASGCDEDFEFEFSLEVLISGIAQLRRTGWSSPEGRTG